MRKEWIVVVAMLVTACAPVRPSIKDQAMLSPAAGRYPVTVERGTWVGVDSLPLGVYVDRKLVATVGGGQMVTMYIEEGRHSIGVGPDDGVPEALVPDNELAIDVSSTSKPILHASVASMGYGGWKLERVAQ
ncbi:hypothetical protein FHW69_001423 [Luteibacter sp. Sphag1AF]|uniref:hypothetical protein n=1 Tax=Luteibacter sp. Sphag1AF TaxID=2587031 RepID=UPI00161C12B3|nr:hypothetical protein [Luteibacter sp. Sphag1AF]MBB3226822.1 hypothetical protein [Luteibacter sp. Sphag1AF]